MFPLARFDFHPRESAFPASLKDTIIEHQLPVDSTADTPYIAKTFIDHNEKLRHKRISPIPPNAISLHSADGTPLEILGCIRFTLKLGNKSLPVGALVFPYLGPDAILIDNSIMKAFRAKSDWAAERISFQDSNLTLDESKYRSVIAQTSMMKKVFLYRFLRNTFVIAAAHDVRDVWRNGGVRGLCGGARKKGGWGVSWTISAISASTPTSGRLQPRTRGNGAERQNKGRNISWRNGPLQTKPRLDYGMQWYART